MKKIQWSLGQVRLKKKNRIYYCGIKEGQFIGILIICIGHKL